jgi:hypothetical protein
MVLCLLVAAASSLQHFDYDYGLDTGRLEDAIAAKVTALHVDDGVRAFIAQCERRFGSIAPMLLDYLSLSLLRPFFSPTTVNGLAFRGASRAPAHRAPPPLHA